VILIQPQFFQNPHQWGVRKVAELAERMARADAYFVSTTPDWHDPLPAGPEQAKAWRLVCKNIAQQWEHRLLKANVDDGQPDPTGGYKGMRVYHCADNRLAEQLLSDVRWLMGHGAPGTWHGRHIVQLPEADWVVPLDHPDVRYAPFVPPINVDQVVPSHKFPAGHVPSSDDLVIVGWDRANAARIAWCLECRPSGPVQLNQVTVITDPQRFLAQLAIDALAGPRGPRARTGALLKEVDQFAGAVGPEAN
jgi:hypothetical protein